jgi:phenylacetate-CoA ligase
LSLSVHEAGAPDTAMIGSALKPLVGDVPLKVTLDNLAQDAKPQRYTSELAAGVLD